MASRGCRPAVRDVRPDRLPKADGQAVPAVDGDDRPGQRDLLCGVELTCDLGIDIIGRAALGQEGERLGPGEGRPLAWAEDRRFTPDGDEVEPLRLLAHRLGVLGVHVHAVGAAVDL